MEDAVVALERVMYVKEFTTINIAHPRVVEMEFLARRFCEIYGRDYGDQVKEVDLPPQMTLEKIPDVTRQKNLLNFEPRISIEEGIQRVAQRILQDYGDSWMKMVGEPARGYPQGFEGRAGA